MKKLLVLIALVTPFKYSMAIEVHSDTRLRDLGSSEFNGGYFGPAIPRTNGIEVVHSYRNLKYGKNTQMLLEGGKCKLSITYGTAATRRSFHQGARYGLQNVTVYRGSISVRGANISQNPEYVVINCGLHKDITIGEVEKDLNGVIQFYPRASLKPTPRPATPVPSPAPYMD